MAHIEVVEDDAPVDDYGAVLEEEVIHNAQLTHDYPMAFVKALRDAGVEKDRKDDEPFRFVYVSGEMADPAEKSLLMWANIKVRDIMDKEDSL